MNARDNDTTDSSQSPISTRRAPTMKDVARLANVSLGTVSRVVNDNPTVAAENRLQVLKAVKELGYRPNAVAQSMRTTETKVVACVVPDVNNPINAAILQAAERRLSEFGYTLFIASTDGNADRELAVVEAFARRRVDGLICVFSNETNPALLEILSESRLPLVLMEREMELACDSIAADHRQGMRDATESLLAQGHRRIAIIAGSPFNRTGRERLAGYKEALGVAGIDLEPVLIRTGNLTPAYAAGETEALMKLSAPPTAIISAGNRTLVGVLRALRMLGKNIPADVSLIAAGESEVAELTSPPISIIRWDLQEFGRTAADLMMNRLASVDNPWRRVVVRTDLIMRKSTRAPSSA